MVLDTILPNSPLISAGWILSRAVALADATILVLVLLISSVVVAWVNSGGKVGNRISVMNNTVLVSHLLIRKGCVSIVTDTRLAEVDHRGRDSVGYQVHGSELSKSSTEGVTSGLDCISRVKLLKTLNFGKRVVID